MPNPAGVAPTSSALKSALTRSQRERIFEPFYRLPGASEREGGVGLGLALVKSISLRHGGTVRCEARPGGGASFVVELPLSQTKV